MQKKKERRASGEARNLKWVYIEFFKEGRWRVLTLTPVNGRLSATSPLQWNNKGMMRVRARPKLWTERAETEHLLEQ